MNAGGTTDALVSRWVDFDGPVHLAERSSPASSPGAGAAVVLVVHGLGGSWVNWYPLLPLLEGVVGGPVRVIAIDLPGFGLSPAAGRAQVTRYAEICAETIRSTDAGRAVVLGNSMGGLVSMLLAAQHPELVAGAVLINTALRARVRHRPDPLVTALFGTYFVPVLGPGVVAARRRLSTPEQMTADTFRLITADPRRVDAVTFQAHVDMARRRHDLPGAPQDFASAARSMMLQLPRVGRLADRMESQGTPTLVLHGGRDRLVPASAAREFARGRRGWTFRVAEGVGHVPQLEVPDWTATRLRDWWPRERF